MKRANQRARQGYPDFRLQSNNIDLSSENDEPKRKNSHRAMSEAVVEGKGDKDDGDINLPMDINENSQSFLSEDPQQANAEKPLQVNMDVEVEKKEEDNEGQIDHTDEDESIPQKASH